MVQGLTSVFASFLVVLYSANKMIDDSLLKQRVLYRYCTGVTASAANCYELLTGETLAACEVHSDLLSVKYVAHPTCCSGTAPDKDGRKHFPELISTRSLPEQEENCVRLFAVHYALCTFCYFLQSFFA